MELIRPTIHSPRPGPSIPKAWGNDRLAPLDPVWSHPVISHLLKLDMLALTLSCCTHGAETDGIPQHFGSMPFVVPFVL